MAEAEGETGGRRRGGVDAEHARGGGGRCGERISTRCSRETPMATAASRRGKVLPFFFARCAVFSSGRERGVSMMKDSVVWF